jgi:hypothetical protein
MPLPSSPKTSTSAGVVGPGAEREPPGAHRRPRAVHDRHGLLVWDGGARRQLRRLLVERPPGRQFAAVGRLKPKNHTLEAFYLDRDEVPESETGTRLWGGNYELAVGEASTFG